ncbi:hypothetical protein J4E89_009317 [Alternaria sp. Ai002NY15]|nr:hypothetical protein J4E89_009317 [Alternaria sp. Ai002NY15]
MASQNSNPNADPVFFGGIEVDITQFDFSDHTSKYLFICQILYAFAIALTKIAIISSYLRFIHDKTFRIWMYAISVCIVGLWISGKTSHSSRHVTCAEVLLGIFVTIFQCRPVQGAWDFTLEPVCVDYVTYLYASSAVNVATDLLLCALPIPHIWRLNMPKRQRIVLCVLLAGGARYV